MGTDVPTYAVVMWYALLTQVACTNFVSIYVNVQADRAMICNSSPWASFQQVLTIPKWHSPFECRMKFILPTSNVTLLSDHTGKPCAQNFQQISPFSASWVWKQV